jgi:type II secretion system protein I
MVRGRQGFTLIEVLISIAILAMVVMSVCSIYTHCTLEIKRAQNRTMASNFAQQMMEMICSSPHDLSAYDGLTTAAAPPSDNPARADLLRWQAALDTFPTEAVGTIAVQADPTIAYATAVTVQITYTNYGRETVSTLTLKVPD